MSAERQMKKIDLETLDQADRKVSLSKLKKIVVGAVVVLVVCIGGYAAYYLITGEVLASRFTVTKMNCPACVMTVQEVTGKLPGVVGSDVSLSGQAVTVRYRSKQTNPEQIKGAIAHAGYPTQLDGVYDQSGKGVDDAVVLLVNGRPIFRKDMKIAQDLESAGGKEGDAAAAFFSLVGREILLQAADAKIVAVQPYEVEQAVELLAKGQNLSIEELAKQATKRFGSVEKFDQMVAQKIAIRKLLDEHILQGIQDPKEKERKTLEWVGAIFKDADVKLVDPDFKEKLHASDGPDEWKTFWPRMIGRKTDLKGVLIQ